MTDAIELELYKHRFSAIAEEMGEVLTLAAFSPNIKERRDHSCALFDENGNMVAQAAHIPVHLGAAPLCVKAVIEHVAPEPGQTAIVNDPFAGGTHLPDITTVTAVSLPGSDEVYYVASRAHHADVGGITPGSLPPSTHIDEEGWRCPPSLLTDEVIDGLLQASRTPEERRGDLAAQRAANDVGSDRLTQLCHEHGTEAVVRMARGLQDYTERRIRNLVRSWPDRDVSVEDVLDDANGDGVPVPIRLRLRVKGDRVIFDFTGSAEQVAGPMNAVRAIVESAVFYTLHCLAGADLPANGGVMRPVEIITRAGSVVDARLPAAVAAGNVETSQRLVDVLFRAFGELLEGRMPACSYGTMNNVLIGSLPEAAEPFVYYETLAGGYGAGPSRDGASGLQAHMTNTLNTPIEALEHAFPMRIEQYRLRHGSGGAGVHRGGEGLVRAYRFETPAVLTMITERRLRGAPGAAGGGEGACGRQILSNDEGDELLGGKFTREVAAGDLLVVETPGGGGWGAKNDR